MFNTERIRFGVFVGPFHPLNGNPTLQLRRGIDLMSHLDDLGFDEAWIGEHHSSGMEIIASPEIFIAAAAEHTKRIRFGTGVASLPYHQPLLVADRIVQLDHQTRGRIMLGTGPGKIPLDAYMMGIDPMRQRAMQGEALDAIMPLLRGEVVNMKTDWFELRDARVQLRPFNPDGIEVLTASVASPNGSVLAGKHGLGLLSLAASDPVGFEALDTNWAVYEKECAAHGHVPRRDTWRVVAPIWVAETRDEARRAVARGVVHPVDYMRRASGAMYLADELSSEEIVELWTTDGLETFGVAVIGTPDDAIASIERLVEKTGGFGTFLLFVHDIMNWEDTKRSFELFANEVIPHFRRSNVVRQASLDYARDHAEQLMGGVVQAVTKATQDYFGDEREVHVR